MTETNEPHLSRRDVEKLNPKELRRVIASGRWQGTTQGLALGHLQANLVVLPEDEASDFAGFCRQNPKPCPLLEATDIGRPTLSRVAAGADVRDELPRYRVFENGAITDEPTEIYSYWEKRMVAFILGCSVTFEEALARAGVPIRHLDEGRKVSSYVTNIMCQPSGRYSGPLVVSMRPIPKELVASAIELTSLYPHSHGSPVHIGNPAAIGIDDLADVVWGSPPQLHPGDVPVFWAGGGTLQFAIQAAKPRIAVTHKPGHMLICDITSQLSSLA